MCLSRRARARAEAVVSGEGGSPKMKIFIKRMTRTTMESWPRKKEVKDRLDDGTVAACGDASGGTLEARL